MEGVAAGTKPISGRHGDNHNEEYESDGVKWKAMDVRQ